MFHFIHRNEKHNCAYLKENDIMLNSLGVVSWNTQEQTSRRTDTPIKQDLECPSGSQFLGCKHFMKTEQFQERAFGIYDILVFWVLEKANLGEWEGENVFILIEAATEIAASLIKSLLVGNDQRKSAINILAWFAFWNSTKNIILWISNYCKNFPMYLIFHGVTRENKYIFM